MEKGIVILTSLKSNHSFQCMQELKLRFIQKREILCSTFLEKIIFEKNKSRTERLNEVFYHMLQIDRNIQKQKTGQIHKNLILSG